MLGFCPCTGAQGPLVEPAERAIIKRKETRRKIMSAKHSHRLSLFGVTLAAALAVGVASPALAQRRGVESRAGTAEFGLQIMDFSGTHVTGTHGAALDVDGDIAWGLVGGYNFTDKFQLGGSMSWSSPDYRL